jgi:hypothetical protein
VAAIQQQYFQDKPKMKQQNYTMTRIRNGVVHPHQQQQQQCPPGRCHFLLRHQWKNILIPSLILVGCLLLWGDHQRIRNSTSTSSSTRRPLVQPQRDFDDRQDVIVSPPDLPSTVSYSSASPSSPSSNSSLSSSSSSLQFHILSTWLLDPHPTKIFLFELGSDKHLSGFGSCTVNLMLLQLYFTDVHSYSPSFSGTPTRQQQQQQHQQQRRQLVVDETPSRSYRWNETHGVYSGYFQTTFPILQQSNQEYKLIRQQVVGQVLLEKQSHHRDDGSNGSNNSHNNDNNHSTTSRHREDNHHNNNNTNENVVVDKRTTDKFWKFTQPDFYTGKYMPPLLPWNEFEYRNTTLDLPVIKVTQRTKFFSNSFVATREMALHYYNNNNNNNRNDHNTEKKDTNTETSTSSLRLFQRLSQLLCHSIQVNSDVQGRIARMQEIAGIPLSTTTTTTMRKEGITTTPTSMVFRREGHGDSSSSRTLKNTETTTTIAFSVAFHIRRGDKLIRESRKYEAVEYVEKLVAVTTDEERSRIRDCFVATDDDDPSLSVVDELQAQLTVASISCTVSTLTSTSATTPPTSNATAAVPSNTRQQQRRRQGGDEFILFLAQLDILIHSTYFIGTFNSNVGKLVTLYRGCSSHVTTPSNNDDGSGNGSNSSSSGVNGDWTDPRTNFNDDQVSTKLNHYYLSYGVDAEDWYLR